MKWISRRAALIFGSAFAILLAAGCSGSEGESEAKQSHAAKSADNESAYALITQPVGEPAPEGYADQLLAAQSSGEIQNVVFLHAKPSSEGPLGFQSMAIAEFQSDEAYSEWLAGAAPELGDNLIVRRADILVDDRAQPDPKAAYVVSHYEALVSPEEYTEYTTDYISPNMNGQKAAGLMTGYAMYYEREPVPGLEGNRTVLVKQYVNEDAFSRIEAVKEKDKKKLLQDPEWKRINDTKDQLRNDISGTLARPLPVD